MRTDVARRHSTNPDLYWCNPCYFWVDVADMNGFTKDDDKTVEMCCPGCDSTMFWTDQETEQKS